ncbi:MAG: hypothetical protein ACYDIE_02565 [Candidatus Krumholzibacteriia bacterium]
MAERPPMCAASSPRRAPPARRAFAFVLLLACVAGSGWALAETGPPRPVGQLPDSAVAESLRLRVARLRAIAALPDSIKGQAIDEALQELGGALESLTQELSNLDVQVEDQAISLRDRTGGGRVRINIPPDLGTRISQGITSITASILDELPDTLVIRGGKPGAHWRVATPSVRDAATRIFSPPPPPPPPPRRVVGGDVVRVFGDVEVPAEEDVRGDVIAVFGAVTVRGHVDGRVMSVLGDVQLAGDAEVGHDVVALVGHLHRDPQAEVGGSVFALDSGLPGGKGGLRRMLVGGWLAFAAKLLLLLATLLLMILLFALVPRDRLDRALDALCTRPTVCLGQGLLWLFAGHLLLAFLMAVLILTLIGIPLALLLGVAYLALALLALGVTSHQLGVRVAAAWGLGWSHRLAFVVLGLCLLHLPGLLGALLGLIPGLWAVAATLVGLDALLRILALAYGLGALILCHFGRRAVPPPPPPAGAAACVG